MADIMLIADEASAYLTAKGYSRLAEIFYKKLVSQVQACK